MNNQKIKTLLLATLMAILAGFNQTAFGQQDDQPSMQQSDEDYSNEELKEFIDANEEVMKVQQQAEQKMMSAIEDEGLDIDTFNQILSSKQQGSQDDTQASDADMKKFNKAAEKVMEIQQETNVDVEEAIKDSGMELEKYKAMMVAYQQNPDLQQKVNQMLEEEK